MPLILGTLASAAKNFLWAPAGAYDFIATGTVGSNAVTFTSIPATYTHLQIRGTVRAGNHPYNTDDAILMRVGATSVDTGANYSQHFLYGDGASVAAGGSANSSYMQVADMPAASTTANTFGAFIVDILDYANTNKYKTTRSLSGFDTNTTLGYTWLFSGNWRNTAAIDTISLAIVGFGDAATIGTNSRVDLYGIK
jgi:hypothetical protein